MIQCKFNAWSRALKAGALGQARVWGGEGGRRGVQDGGTNVHPMADSCWCMAKKSQYFKAIILQLK